MRSLEYSNVHEILDFVKNPTAGNLVEEADFYQLHYPQQITGILVVGKV